jgi:hypothetical protein
LNNFKNTSALLIFYYYIEAFLKFQRYQDLPSQVKSRQYQQKPESYTQNAVFGRLSPRPTK